MLWLNSAQGITLSGGTVSAWADASGNGLVAVPTTAGPAMLSNATNGLPAVSFNGSQGMYVPALQTGGSVTMFVVSANETFYTNAPNHVDPIVTSDISGVTPPGGIDINSYNWFSAHTQRQINGDTGGPGSTTSYLKNGNASPLTVDWGEFSAYTFLGTNVNSRTGFYIGQYADGAYQSYNKVCEIILYLRTLTSSEQATVISYLETKYNIPAYFAISGNATVPNYQNITHMEVPSSVLSTNFSRPFPTNIWFENAYYGTTQNVVKTHPYTCKFRPYGLEICYPVHVDAQATESETYAESLSLEAVETLQGNRITGFGDLTLAMDWPGTGSQDLNTTVVRGCPYMTLNYTSLTPKIHLGSALTTVNGVSSGTVTGTKFKIVMSSGQTWIVYATVSLSLTVTSSTVLTATAAYTGSLRAAYMPLSGDETILDTYSTCIPTGATVSRSVSGTNALMTFAFSTTGTGSLLMMALPHHVNQMSSPTTVTTTYRTMKGFTTGIVGTTWNLTIPIPQVTWNSPTAIDPTHLAAIQTAVQSDCNLTVSAPDPYFSGKEQCRLARVALIADQIGDTASRNTALANLKANLNTWLNSSVTDRLRYDQRWGGIISQVGAQDPGNDFNQGWYSDHHFHYGYKAYAAAVVAKFDPTWLATYKNQVYDLVRDYCNWNPADQYYPVMRVKDWYNGHSWTGGLGEANDGRNQESSSESMNGYYGAYLWGLVNNDANLIQAAQIGLATEVESVKLYYHMVDTSIYGPLFAANGTGGVMWDTKFDYATYFGTNMEYIHEIQTLPVTPLTEFYLTSAIVTADYPVIVGATTRNASATCTLDGNGRINSVSFSGGLGGFSTPNGTLSITSGSFPAGPTSTLTFTNNIAGGNLSGTYAYRVSYVNGSGETAVGFRSVVGTAANTKIQVNNIPIGPAGTTARKIYRDAGNGDQNLLKLVATISDNTTTTYLDNVADGSLGSVAQMNANLSVTLDSTGTITGFSLVNSAGGSSAGGSGYSSPPTLSVTPGVIADSWRGFIVCKHAVIDKADAWTEALTLSSYDDGNSKSNVLYWIATRP